MIKNIRHSVLYEGKNYFHPAISQYNDGLMMTTQTFEGVSDTYGPLVYTLSNDNGRTWNSPKPIKSLGINMIGDGLKEGIADVRPLFHKQTGSVILTGCNTYYGKHGCVAWSTEFKDKLFPQFPVYAIYDKYEKWSTRKILTHDFFSKCNNWRTACAQAIVLENGNVLLPIYFQKNQEQNNYSVCTVKCFFDGIHLKAEKVSNILSFPIKRGFCEPSITYFDGKYYMTIRAEDDHAYLSVSNDGLNWRTPVAWKWDDGSYLITSSTQQHWISTPKGIYLVYTRKDECNKNVMRWRAPLFVALFVPEKNYLLRDSEKILFPLRKRNGIPNLLGNFHAVNINSSKSIVSDGSLWLKPKNKDTIADYYSEVWISEIEWFA